MKKIILCCVFLLLGCISSLRAHIDTSTLSTTLGMTFDEHGKSTYKAMQVVEEFGKLFDAFHHQFNNPEAPSKIKEEDQDYINNLARLCIQYAATGKLFVNPHENLYVPPIQGTKISNRKATEKERSVFRQTFMKMYKVIDYMGMDFLENQKHCIQELKDSYSYVKGHIHGVDLLLQKSKQDYVYAKNLFQEEEAKEKITNTKNPYATHEELLLHQVEGVKNYIRALKGEGKPVYLVMGAGNYERNLFERFNESYIFLDAAQEYPTMERMLSVNFNDIDQMNFIAEQLEGLFDRVVFDYSVTKFVKWKCNDEGKFPHLYAIKNLLSPGGTFIMPMGVAGGFYDEKTYDPLIPAINYTPHWLSYTDQEPNPLPHPDLPTIQVNVNDRFFINAMQILQSAPSKEQKAAEHHMFLYLTRHKWLPILREVFGEAHSYSGRNKAFDFPTNFRKSAFKKRDTFDSPTLKAIKL